MPDPNPKSLQEPFSSVDLNFISNTGQLTSKAYPLPMPSDAPVTTGFGKGVVIKKGVVLMLHGDLVMVNAPAHCPYLVSLTLDMPHGARTKAQNAPPTHFRSQRVSLTR